MSNDITYWSITEMRLVKKLHDFAYSSNNQAIHEYSIPEQDSFRE